MDVNSVLQNTRQYFQGVPTSSPASGELAPGASVGYNSPPVSSTATVTATSGTNPYPSPFQQQPFPPPPPPQQQQTVPWSTSNTHHAANAYHTSSSSTASLVANNAVAAAYSRNYPPTSMSAKYHMYENAVRSSPKMPSSPNMPPFAPQHNYLQAPSVTRYRISNIYAY